MSSSPPPSPLFSAALAAVHLLCTPINIQEWEFTLLHTGVGSGLQWSAAPPTHLSPRLLPPSHHCLPRVCYQLTSTLSMCLSHVRHGTPDECPCGSSKQVSSPRRQIRLGIASYRGMKNEEKKEQQIWPARRRDPTLPASRRCACVQGINAMMNISCGNIIGVWISIFATKAMARTVAGAQLHFVQTHPAPP